MGRDRRTAAIVTALCLGLALCLTQAAWSQQVTAAITGTITDPSGAPIAGAKVTARDVDRGVVYSSETNAQGVYNLPRVPIGRYDVRAESQGFQSMVQSGITLDVNQTARVDFQMPIGQVSESVEVTSAPPLLTTENTQLSTVIDATTNVNLPLATRNYVQLTLLAPGSVNPNPSTLTTPQGPGGGGRPYINGNREQANNFLLDGMDNNQVSDNLVGYTPSVDAIQEFNLITQNASAEFGNFQGGIISTSLKSGTNQYHGDLFEFFRNDVLNAYKWENKWNGSNVKDKLRWNMFGATFGGPIKKEKLFFFVDYQGQRFNQPATSLPITVFTAAERQGDFSQLLSVKGIQLYNPFQVDAKGNRVPFPNNQIPLSLLDPVAKNLFSSSLYPAPVNSGLTNNFFNARNSHIYADQGDAKADWNITSNDRLMVRYSQSFQDNPTLNSFPLLFNSFNEAPIKNGVVNWTKTVSPTMVNEFRVGLNYVKVNNGAAYGEAGNICEQLGIAGVNGPGPGLLGLQIRNGAVSDFGNQNTYQLFADTVFQIQDGLIITKGRHTLHTGFQFWRNLINSFYGGNNGLLGFMNFSGRFTAGPNALSVAGSGSGAGEADFFLGLPDSFGRGIGNFGTWGQRSSTIGAYIQDDFRATNSLTLNLGLRYETHTPWVEVADRQDNFGMYDGSIQLPQNNVYGNRGLYHSYNAGLDFQPRVGFAWTPEALGRKTVFRGAYTISSYLEGTGTNLRLTMNPPFKTPEFQTNYHDTPLPATRTDAGILPPNTGNPFDQALIRLWDPNVQPAIVQQWNFAIQEQLGNSTTLQAAYVGQKGTHLMVPMPYLQSELHSDGTITRSPYLSGNPQLANISQISGTASNGTQRYDALQITLQKRFTQGLQYQVAYTYSKCMTKSSGYYGSWGGQTTPTSAYWQNLYDMRAEWGPCYYDVPHVLTSYAVYELPVGRGRKFGTDMNRAVDALIGGWQVSGILSLHDGYALTVSADDASHTNSRGARANCIAPANVLGTVPATTGGYQWFDPHSYAPPAPGTFGTCGVGTVRGPGQRTFDLSLQKQFAITESKRFEFRGEAINLTNTPILNSPGTALGASLGQVTTSQGERNIQFALKFYF